MWPLTAVLVRNVPTSQRGVTDALVARLGTVAVSGCFRPCRPAGRSPGKAPAGAAGRAGIRPPSPVAARAEAGTRQN